MKTYIHTIILVVAMSLLGFQANAQGNKRVTGPKAKNIKSRDRLTHIEKISPKEEAKPKGPEAKNRKPSERLTHVEKSNNQEVDTLKGPKAKNKKQFKK